MKRFVRAAILIVSSAAWLIAQTDNSAREKLIQSLDDLALKQLAERAQAMAKIQTREEAEKRKALVRRKILDLIGGLPAHQGPVAVKAVRNGGGRRIPY